MKTTDSVMREKLLQDFDTHMTREWKKHVDKFPESNNSQFESGFDVAQDIAEKFYSHSLAEARREERNKLQDYCTHQDDCILSYWSAGRPTKNGGYERKYGEKWYQSRPVDKTPKCTCGLSDLLTGDNPERK